MHYISTHQQMTACDHPTLMDRVRNKLDKFALIFRSIGRRRHLASLGQLSNQQLSDIGLQRDDIYESAALGMSDDVTVHLAQIARQRRRGVYRSNMRQSD